MRISVKKFIQSISFIFLISLFLYGCSSLTSDKTTSLSCRYETTAYVNPNQFQQASPIVVQTLQLRSADKFNNANFFDLYQDPGKILGPDLIDRKELELQPNQRLTVDYTLNKDTCCIGFIGAYRDLNNKKWRQLLMLPNQHHLNIRIHVGRSGIRIIE